MFAQVTLIGNIGADAEMRYTPEGKAVSSFNVAVTRKRRGGDQTTWVRVSVWEKMAESLTQYLTKGKQVFIVGELEDPNAYMDKKTNEPRATIQVTAREIKLLGGKPAGSDGGDGSRQTAPTSGRQQVDEEIPF